MKLSARDKLIIAAALSLCPLAELGDRVGGDDTKTAKRLIELARMFDEETADTMELIQQFKFRR